MYRIMSCVSLHLFRFQETDFLLAGNLSDFLQAQTGISGKSSFANAHFFCSFSDGSAEAISLNNGLALPRRQLILDEAEHCSFLFLADCDIGGCLFMLIGGVALESASVLVNAILSGFCPSCRVKDIVNNSPVKVASNVLNAAGHRFSHEREKQSLKDIFFFTVFYVETYHCADRICVFLEYLGRALHVIAEFVINYHVSFPAF